MKLLALFVSLIFIVSNGWALDVEFYSQTVYLHKFHNPITQNRLILRKTFQTWDIYGGLWLDQDRKTNKDASFTDSQVSPLLGIHSHVYGLPWLYSRFFLEGRWVNRTESFPDKRMKSTYELQGGLIGYGLLRLNSSFFLEQYYAAFFSRLYGEKFIFQGWSKQGFRFWNRLDFFNEVFVDTFDQTRDRDGTLDLRPGVRVLHHFKEGSIQLMHQSVYHFTNINFAGRSEGRTTFVLGLYL